MKLINKKTGEVVDAEVYHGGSHAIKIEAKSRHGDAHSFYYDSLESMHEDWEDSPEEPKGFWYIDDFRIMCGTEGEFTTLFTKEDIEKLKAIGNYFETKEKAEKTVEKLKAFKRLKDKGFEFCCEIEYEGLCGNGFNIPLKAIMPPEAYTDAEVSKDLELLFGGEE